MYNIKSYFSGQAPAPDVITLSFEKEGPKITIQIVQSSDRFRYSCAVDGNPIKEIVRQMQKNDSTMNDFIITIPEIDITRSADEDSKGVVWYTVYVVFESSLSLTSTRTHSQYNHRYAYRISENILTKCRRRFSHFHDLHTDISSVFACSHLQSMLPVFPSRQWKLFVDHLAPDFIETRRAGLERYIQQLTRVPHVRDEPEFLQFVNMFVAKRLEFSIVSNTGVFTCSVGPHLPSLQISLESREYSFVFPGSKPLGLVFRCERPTDMNVETFVVNFKSVDDTKGVAESSGRIKIGDCLTRINGRAVLGKLCYRDIITTIKTFRARHGDLVPMVLHFRRRKGDSNIEEKEDDDDDDDASTPLEEKSHDEDGTTATTVVSEI